MKLLFTLVFTLLSLAASANPIEGLFIVDKDSQRIFHDLTSNRRLQLIALNKATLESLSRLNHLDYIRGQGEIVGDVMLITSIDFVALRRLLGFWKAGSRTLLSFENYSKLVVYPDLMTMKGRRTTYEYSIIPTNGPGWKIFMTDHQAVHIGNLMVANTKATLEVIDPNDGSVVKTFDMSRLDK